MVIIMISLINECLNDQQIQQSITSLNCSFQVLLICKWLINIDEWQVQIAPKD